MAYVKCRYVTMGCNWQNKSELCIFKKGEYPGPYECEWQDEEGDYQCCRITESKEHYIEGEYKRIKFDGVTLFLGNKNIASKREMTFYGQEYEEGIHYLEIDGHVYINDDDDTEDEQDVDVCSAGAVAGSE